MDICHELAVAEGEISHVPARLGSCQHLQQRWEGRKRRLDSESAKKQKHKILSDTQIFFLSLAGIPFVYGMPVDLFWIC